MFLFLIGFLSSFSYLFHVFCLCLFLCLLLSFSFLVSFYCFSSFFLDLPYFAWFSLFIFGFLFLPPSPLPSFPYLSSSFSFPLWVILLSPLVPLSRLLSRFSVPFRLGLSFRCFLFVLSPYFSLPRSSPFLSLSLLLHFLLPLLPFWFVLTPLCCVPLRSVSLSPFLSWLSSLSFSLYSFASFSASSSSRPCSCLLRIFVPLFIYLASSFSASLTSSSFSA